MNGVMTFSTEEGTQAAGQPMKRLQCPSPLGKHKPKPQEATATRLSEWLS